MTIYLMPWPSGQEDVLALPDVVQVGTAPPPLVHPSASLLLTPSCTYTSSRRWILGQKLAGKRQKGTWVYKPFESVWGSASQTFKKQVPSDLFPNGISQQKLARASCHWYLQGWETSSVEDIALSFSSFFASFFFFFIAALATSIHFYAE